MWFVYVVYSECINDGNDYQDIYGHSVPLNQPFLKCHYLERHVEKKKGVTYRKNKDIVNIFRESIVYPLVDMEEKDTGVFFLDNTHFFEILNYVQYSAMACIKC